MIYYIKKLKVAIDFEAGAFVRCKHVPVGAVPVDLVAVEPGCTETRLQHLTLDMKPCAVLYLSAWDAATFVTILQAVERLSGGMYRLFHGNPDTGLRSVVRTALDLPAPGECGYWKRQQLAARPADWQALQGAA